MPLEATLKDIVARLRQASFPSEQAISQGIVLRLLQDLGWDTWDTNVVWPEYQTGEGRVDFALCRPPSKPAVFIEVKQPGKAEEAVRQALEYAFHTGVPFTILTDGRTWSFYLPAEQGSYEDRRVYKLDVFERPAAESAETLSRYLARVRVESGEALETARQEYRSLNRRAQPRAAVPEAWRELVAKDDEDLVGRHAAEGTDYILELICPDVLRRDGEDRRTEHSGATSDLRDSMGNEHRLGLSDGGKTLRGRLSFFASSSGFLRASWSRLRPWPQANMTRREN
jgi:Type I restriction enzyme R protein N terminus (HSDR_N)